MPEPAELPAGRLRRAREAAARLRRRRVAAPDAGGLPEGHERLADALSPVGAWDAEFAALTALPHPQGRRRPGSCLPSPLVSLWSAPPEVRRAWRQGDPRPLADLLRSPRPLAHLLRSLSPLVEPAALPGDQSPATAATLLSSYLLDPRAASAREQLLSAARALWTAAPSEVRQRDRVPGLVSVVLAFDGRAGHVRTSLEQLLSGAEDLELEVVVVDSGAAVDAALDMAALGLRDARLRYDPATPPLPQAQAFQRGLAISRGERVVLVGPDIRLDHGWLPPLVSALDDDRVIAAQPVILDRARSIAATGLGVGSDRLAFPLLEGHPAEDVTHVETTALPAVGGGVVAARAADVEAAGGPDLRLTGMLLEADLCFRLAARRPGRFTVVPRSTVTRTAPARAASPAQQQTLMETWSGELARAPWPTSRALLADAAERRPAGSLRWGLRIASTPGSAGDLWGDTHFAASLGRALRELGQEVVVHRRGFHSRPGSEADDVVLGIRGPVPVLPVTGKVNVLWVISHPEEVTAEELGAFDLVYAASVPWAQRMARTAGRDVRPLLQAVDERLVPASGLPRGDGRTPVFVGTTLNRTRAIVLDAVEAGLPVAVHGPGWQGKVPPALHRGDHVPNDELLLLYRRHGLVLADHWPDMARQGFLSNRLFDAVAAGCRVISDEVAGGFALFEGAVQSCAGPEELRRLVTVDGVFPPDEALEGIARQLLAQHSFSARARQLLHDVLAVRG